MSWQQWVLVTVIAASALATVAVIGKPRDPMTPGLAIGALIIDAALIALVVSL